MYQGWSKIRNKYIIRLGQYSQIYYSDIKSKSKISHRTVLHGLIFCVPNQIIQNEIIHHTILSLNADTIKCNKSKRNSSSCND